MQSCSKRNELPLNAKLCVGFLFLIHAEYSKVSSFFFCAEFVAPKCPGPAIHCGLIACLMQNLAVLIKSPFCFQQNEQQNQNYGAMNYGQQNMQQGMQGNMANMGYGTQGMPQQQQSAWMGGQMMGNYGYGNQSFPTAYPQSYGNQGYGKKTTSAIVCA